MRRALSSLFLAGSLLVSPLTSAEEVSLKHQGLTLNANLTLAEDSGYERMFLITHGTLAHNGMEIITTWQELLSDEGISSLAINLSLGQDNRHGMYDCPSSHNHKHTDAVSEIGQWVTWLKGKGSQEIILAAHSRGGNQTAWYSDENSDSAVKAQVLLAPQTWSETYELENYAERYKKPLTPILKKAKQMPAETVMQDTDFIYCEKTSVTAGSFVNYYQPDTRFDTPTLLQSTTIPTLVIGGSEDTTVPGLHAKMSTVNNEMITSVEIEGAGHFFRDLYMDEVIENTIEFLDSLQ